jgi:hypothetical protein
MLSEQNAIAAASLVAVNIGFSLVCRIERPAV